MIEPEQHVLRELDTKQTGYVGAWTNSLFARTSLFSPLTQSDSKP